MRVFLLDDSTLIRDSLKRLLGELPDLAVCGEAGTLEEGVARIKALRPNLVILDIALPDGSGLDVIARIKTIDSRILILVFSDLAYPQYRRRALKLGASAIFDKGKEISSLETFLRSLGAERYGAYA